MLIISSSYVAFKFKTSLLSETTSLVSSKLGKIFFNLKINTDGLRDFPSLSDDEYDKQSFSSAVEKALYMLS